MSFDSHTALGGELVTVAAEHNLITLLITSGRLLRARWRWWLTLALLIFIGVLLAAYGRSQKYESSAKLLVQLDVQTVALSPADVRYNVAAKMLDEAVGTQVELLRSHDLLERVIDQVGENILDTQPKSGLIGTLLSLLKFAQASINDTLITLGLAEPKTKRQQLADTISDGLKILPARKSQLIDLSLHLKNRAATEPILKALIEQHTKKLAEMEDLSQAYSTYSAQAQQIKTDLEQAEAAIAAFKRKHNFVNLATEKAGSLQNADRVQALLDGIEGSARIGASDDAAAANNQNAESEPISETDLSAGGNDLTRLAARVNDLRLEKTKRAATYVPGHARLDEINSQLAAAESLLRSKLRLMHRALAGYQTRSRVLDSVQPEFNQLTRTASVLEDNYKAYIKASEDRRLASAKNRRVWLMVVDAPAVPDGPVAPTRLMLVLGGLAGSLVLAGLAVLVNGWWRLRVGKVG